jgi:hypothetical protein
MVSNVRASIGVSALIGLTLSALLMLMSTAPAQAQTLEEECQAEIATLNGQTANATFIGQNAAKDEASLIGKLDSASVKLERGKYGDALANLQSFRAKVDTLDQQGKIADEDALELRNGADEAIACVQRLIDAQATSAA